MGILTRNHKPSKEQFEKAIKGYELLIEKITASNLAQDAKETLIVILRGYINLIKSGKL